MEQSKKYLQGITGHEEEEDTNGHTVPFFSIEMRYLEVYYRMLSIISKVPFLRFLKNELTHSDKIKVATAKVKTFYKYAEQKDLFTKWLTELQKDGNLLAFDNKIKIHKPILRNSRFFIVDEPALTPNRLDHLCNVFYNKYPKFTMAVVDYLNIIRVPDSKEWKTQIQLAENLKGYARKYNITLLSPYQVDSTLEARYAKGILDAFDRAFTFAPADPDDKENENRLTLYTAKIRNGKNTTFSVGMDWECVSIDNTLISTKNINSKLLPGSQYGSGKTEQGKEQAKDV